MYCDIYELMLFYTLSVTMAQIKPCLAPRRP